MRPGLLALPLKWGITVRGARGSLHFGQSAPSSSWYVWTGTCTHGAERRGAWPSQEQLKEPLLQVQCFAHGWRVARVCSPRLCWGTLLKPKQVLFLQGQKLVGYLPKASRRSCWRIAPTKNLMSWGMKSRRKKDGKRHQSGLKLYLAFLVRWVKKKFLFCKIPCWKSFCPLITDCNSGVLPLVRWHGLRWEA